MGNGKFKNSAEFENAKSILGMCYDGLTQIQENMFLVTLDGEQSLIDIDNKTLLDLQDNQVKNIGNLIFLSKNSHRVHQQLDLNTLKVSDCIIGDIKECGEAVIVDVLSEGYGLLGRDGEYLMPPIYKAMLINKVNYNSISVWVKYKENEFITEVSTDGTRVSKLDDKSTLGTTTRFISTKFDTIRTRGTREYHLKYELAKNYDIVTNSEFDGLMFQTAYIPFGLIHTWKNQFAGLIRTDGKVVVPNNRFKTVDSIGHQGICIVGESKEKKGIQFGVYKEDKGLTVDTVFHEKTTLQNVPITYFSRDIIGGNDWWILGNDGYVHKELIESFPMSKLNISGIEAYKLNVYGHDYIVNKAIQPLKDIKYGSEHWVSMN